MNQPFKCVGRKAKLAGLTAALLVSFFLIPQKARAAGASDIISLIRTITSTIQSSIGGALNQIRSIENSINNFRQQNIWPVNLINRTKGFVISVRGQYQGVFSQIQQIPIHSATLANPSRLESTLSQGAGIINQVQPKFLQVYGPLPSASDAQPLERNVSDMDDAVAVGSLETTMVAEQTSKSMLAFADALEQQTATAAPGSAAFLSAQARVASLENQAQFARMLATQLRQSATELAHETAETKKDADSTRSLRNQMQQLLTR